ncbi:glycosyltransferase [Lacibacter luteus]|uniref:Glycosyltransferase n=1 Tax=Lacibacter luteus TaxID=2508719 RepID=A0A4V1M6Y9_9BACT|nr:glycosyltransferase [Lacibacter luteus]RXK57427.1 glycosyltransferase [Lacibacter luteus]
MKGISVIICCYNSAERIGATLKHLKGQMWKEDACWEVILIDNNCTDNTVNAALTVWENHPVKLKLVKEQKAGLIHAREAGIRAAVYDYLVFCDDDNWLDEIYIQTVFTLFENNEQAGAIGGQSTIAVQNGEMIPTWFKAEENAYAVGKQAMQSGDVTERLYLWGAGLAVRKHIAEKCFDEDFPFLLTGRSGKAVTAGDDSEICNRIVLMGYRLLYDERLKYEHFIPSIRLTEDYLIQMKNGFERSYGVLTLYSECIRAIVLNKRSKAAVLRETINERPFNKGKLLRMVYWIYGLALYVNNDMRMIRAYYKKHLSY